MQLPRMTTRRWMIVVLGVALATLVVEMERRAVIYRRCAYEHYVLAGGESRWTALELRKSEKQKYHMNMMQKWLGAQRHPWMSVEPDPPPPEPEP